MSISDENAILGACSDNASDPEFATTDHLIIVPCHAVFCGTNFTDFSEPSNWSFDPYRQYCPYDNELGDELATVPDTGTALACTFKWHIICGLRSFIIPPGGSCAVSAEEPPESFKFPDSAHGMSCFLDLESAKRCVQSSLLIFSGGVTKAQHHCRSEALSYYLVAEAARWFGVFDCINNSADNTEEFIALARRHIYTEEFSRDSFENLLFSIARFYEITGRYPKFITVGGYQYKRHRFTEFHRHAIRFPRSLFFTVGIDTGHAIALEKLPIDLKNTHIEIELKGSPGAKVKKLNAAVKKGTALYKLLHPEDWSLNRVTEDLYGMEINKATRRRNNASHKVPAYLISAPELSQLLSYKGPELFSGELPWDKKFKNGN